LAAVLADSGLGIAAIADQHMPSGRNPCATRRRFFANLADGTPITAKLLPVAWPFDLPSVIRIQQRFAAETAFATPRILAQGRTDSWLVVVEEQVVGARTLRELVDDGTCSRAEAAQLVSGAVLAARPAVGSADVRCAGERLQVFEALERAPLLNRHRMRIRCWLEANYNLVSHAPVDAHGDCAPDNLMRRPGDDRWWLIDFDLARTTSLLWQQFLRIGRLTSWDLPGWEPSWGHPHSLALSFLSRLLEWNLQVQVTANGAGAGEHAIVLAQAAECWADTLGPPSRQAPSPNDPPRSSSADGIQVFWPQAGVISESDSWSGTWPVDGVERALDIDAPAPVRGYLRIDPADAPCCLHLHRIEINDSATGWQTLPLNKVTVAGDALTLADEDGSSWFCSLGSDPQLLLNLPKDVNCIGVRLAGSKHPGLDPALAERLSALTGCDPSRLAPLIRAGVRREQQLIAQLRADLREAQARLAAPNAAVERVLACSNVSVPAIQAAVGDGLRRADRLEADMLVTLAEARAASERWAYRLSEANAALEHNATALVESQAQAARALIEVRQVGTELTRQVAELTADRSATERRLAEQHTRLGEYERTGTALVESQAQTARALIDARQAGVELTQQFAELTADRSATERRLAEQQARLSEYERTDTDLHLRLNESLGEITAAKTAIQELHARIQVLTDEHRATSQLGERLAQERDLVRTQARETTETLTKTNEALTKLRGNRLVRWMHLA